MPKKFIKRFLPDSKKIRDHTTLNRLFGNLLHDPNLLHLNRRSVSGAFFVGLFMAFVPMPLQMVAAAGAAIYWRVNLPISVALVWISNPITIPPIFYFCYKVGQWVLGGELQTFTFELSINWLAERIVEIWQPLLLGSFICSLVSATLGFVLIRLLWRLHIVRHKQLRQARTANNRQNQE